MGETTQLEFSDRGYRQLVAALREVNPPAAPAEAPVYDILISQGEAGYIDPQGLIRWIAQSRITEIPDTWRPLLVGPSRREAER